MRRYTTVILALFFLLVTASFAQVTLTWDASTSPDVEGYNMYRSMTPGSGYVKINLELITGLTYTDSDVAEGITYYYVCTAERSNIESGFSNQVQWKAPWVSPPLPPSNLGLVQQGANNYLNWNAPDELGGVDRYLIAFSDNANGPWNLAYTTTDTNYAFKAHPNSGPNYISVQSEKDNFASDRAIVRRR